MLMARDGTLILEQLFNRAIEYGLVPSKLPSTRIGLLFSVIAAELEGWELVLDNFQSELFIQTARLSESIERLIEPFYVKISEQPSYVILKFYWDPESDFDKREDTVIPYGTIVTTIDDPPIEYKTIERCVLYRTAEYVTVKAVSIESGSKSRVDGNSLTQISNEIENIKVTNPEPSWGGRDEESIIEAREKALNMRYYLTKGTRDHLELLLQNLGFTINDYKIIEHAYGYGSFLIIIKTFSENELRAVKDIIKTNKAEGVYFDCISGTQIPITLNISIEMYYDREKDFTPEELKDLETRVKTEIKEYIENHPIGEPFNIRRMTNHLLKLHTDENVFDISAKVTSSAFTLNGKVYCNQTEYFVLSSALVEILVPE